MVFVKVGGVVVVIRVGVMVVVFVKVGVVVVVIRV